MEAGRPQEEPFRQADLAGPAPSSDGVPPFRQLTCCYHGRNSVDDVGAETPIINATAWTVIATGVAVLVAIATSFFRALRADIRSQFLDVNKRIDAQRARIDAQGAELRERIDAQGAELRERIDVQSARIDAQGAELRERIDAQSARIDAQGAELRQHIDARIDAQGAELRQRIDALAARMTQLELQLRERMAKLEGLLEGLREAITGKRAA